MIKAMRSLRTMSTYAESVSDPSPIYEPSPRYEPPAEKLSSSPRSAPSHQPTVVPKEDKDSSSWTKWTIPEGDQITIYRPAPTDHSRYTYTVEPIPNIPTGGRVTLTSAAPITISYPSSSDWTSLPSCLKDCALCAPSPRKDNQYPFLPIFTFPSTSPTNNTGTDINGTDHQNPFTDGNNTTQVTTPKFCQQALLHRSQRARTKQHAKLETPCEECGWSAFAFPALPPPQSATAAASTHNAKSNNSSAQSLTTNPNTTSRSLNSISSPTPHSNPQLLLDASTRSKDPASRDIKKALGGWVSDRFIFESHIAPTVREHRTFLGCWICWEHEGVWVEGMEPTEWWVHLEGHFAGEGYRMCVGENGWMNKRESCRARGCVKIHS